MMMTLCWLVGGVVDAIKVLILHNLIVMHLGGQCRNRDWTGRGLIKGGIPVVLYYEKGGRREWLCERFGFLFIIGKEMDNNRGSHIRRK